MTDTTKNTRRGLSRRALIGSGAAAGVGITLTGVLDSVFGSEASAHSQGHGRGHDRVPGYGPLVPDPDGRLSLPEGFSYTLIAQSGVSTLDTGEPTPDRPDGTASFVRRGGGSILVNNHEISGAGGNPVPHGDGSLVYDTGAFGGTTTIEVDRDGNRIREYVSVAGTHNNCAGGRTPWNTWLTCEETEDVPTANNGLTQRHGYVFEVDPYDVENNRDPKPTKALGRYAHEAVVVDPDTHQLYLTEDAGSPNGLLYRFTPPKWALPLRHGSLRQLGPTDGRLQAMRAFDFAGAFVPDLSVAQVGMVYDIEWVDVPDRDAATVSTRKQFNFGTTSGPGGDITRSRKFEGAWWGDGGAYVVASFARNSDGSAAQHDGQVWFLDPLDRTITLKLQFAYTPGNQDVDADGPDNITVSPFGGVILAEDGEGKQHLVGADHKGRAFFFARNELAGSEEFTGPNFSHDKKLLFANVQVPGHVFAISGPFRRQ